MEKAIYKLSHGMYVLTTLNGGCIVDAVSQVSGGDKPLVSVAVMKENNTNKLLHENDRACLSIIGEKTDGTVIKEFGYNSMRDYNKFNYEKLIDVNGLYAVKDAVGYLMLEKVDEIENDTHTLFIFRVIEDKVLNEDKEITYNYFRENKDELTKAKTAKGKTVWVCSLCGYVYYGEELPANFQCPVCGAGNFAFNKKVL